MSDRPTVQYIQDSGGVTTCHKNETGLNFKQSLIGTLDFRKDGWHVILPSGKDLVPNGGSLSNARRCIEEHYGKSANTIVDETPKPHKTAEALGSNLAARVVSVPKPRVAQKGYTSEELLGLKRTNSDQCTCNETRGEKGIDKTNCPAHREFGS